MSSKRSIFPATVVAAALWSSAAFSAGAHDLSHDYDVAKINQALRTAISKLSLTGSHISNIDAQLDASHTDIEKDKFGFNASFDLSHVGFEKGPVAVKAQSGLKVLPVSKELPHGGMKFKLKAALATDPIAFMHFMVEKADHCEKAKKKSGVDRLIADSHCELSKKIAAAQTLDEMKTAFIAMRSDTVASLSNFVTAATNELAVVQNDVVRQEMSARVKRAQKLLKASEESEIVDLEGGFAVEMGDVAMLDGLLHLNKAKLSFQTDSVRMAKSMTIKTGSMLYGAAKPEVQKLLKGLEDQSNCAIEVVASHMTVKLNVLNAMLD